MVDKVFVREMGIKFIVGFCGVNLYVVLLEFRIKGNVFEVKIGFVVLVFFVWYYLFLIKLFNYRK